MKPSNRANHRATRSANRSATRLSIPSPRTSIRVVVIEAYNKQASMEKGARKGKVKRSKTVTVYGAGFTEVIAMVTLALNGAGSKSGKSLK